MWLGLTVGLWEEAIKDMLSEDGLGGSIGRLGRVSPASKSGGRRMRGHGCRREWPFIGIEHPMSRFGGLAGGWHHGIGHGTEACSNVGRIMRSVVMG